MLELFLVYLELFNPPILHSSEQLLYIHMQIYSIFPFIHREMYSCFSFFLSDINRISVHTHAMVGRTMVLLKANEMQQIRKFGKTGKRCSLCIQRTCICTHRIATSNCHTYSYEQFDGGLFSHGWRKQFFEYVPNNLPFS